MRSDLFHVCCLRPTLKLKKGTNLLVKQIQASRGPQKAAEDKDEKKQNWESVSNLEHLASTPMGKAAALSLQQKMRVYIKSKFFAKLRLPKGPSFIRQMCYPKFIQNVDFTAAFGGIFQHFLFANCTLSFATRLWKDLLALALCL